jgi:hypothetical protein
MDFAFLFISALAVAFIGWAMMVFVSRIEHERQERHADKFGDVPALTAAAVVGSGCEFVADVVHFQPGRPALTQSRRGFVSRRKANPESNKPNGRYRRFHFRL